MSAHKLMRQLISLHNSGIAVVLCFHEELLHGKILSW